MKKDDGNETKSQPETSGGRTCLIIVTVCYKKTNNNQARPRSVSREKYEENWNLAFPSKNKETVH